MRLGNTVYIYIITLVVGRNAPFSRRCPHTKQHLGQPVRQSVAMCVSVVALSILLSDIYIYIIYPFSTTSRICTD